MTYSEPSLPIFTTQSMLTLNSKKNLIKKKLLPFLRLLDKALYIVRYEHLLKFNLINDKILVQHNPILRHYKLKNNWAYTVIQQKCKMQKLFINIFKKY